MRRWPVGYQCWHHPTAELFLDLVFPGVNGFVFDPFDCRSISCGITSYFELSEEQQNSMGVASRQLIQKFHARVMGKSVV